jgi:diketogulonate reductase-like aldo/keto reductase
MPYNPKNSISDQVAVSIASSMKNLRHTEDANESYIDCLVLHSPFPNMKQTQEAWQAMERCVPTQARTLGISNIYKLDALKALYQSATIAPSVVQNRFYPETHYDSSIRQFCREKGIVYQSFWTLTANPKLLRSEPVGNMAAEVGVSREVALYGLVLGLGEEMSVLDGTTNAGRMEEDLKGVGMMSAWAAKAPEKWDETLRAFKGLVDQ